MAVEVDLSGLEKLKKDIVNIDVDEIIVRVGGKLMPDLLQRVTFDTPVGRKPKIESSKGKSKSKKALLAAQRAAWQGYRSGTLKAGWENASNHLHYDWQGDTLTIKAENTTFYADYVEYGHRQRKGRFVPAIGKMLKHDSVKGRFFAENAEKKVQASAEAVIAKETEKAIKEALKDVQ